MVRVQIADKEEHLHPDLGGTNFQDHETSRIYNKVYHASGKDSQILSIDLVLRCPYNSENGGPTGFTWEEAKEE